MFLAFITLGIYVAFMLGVLYFNQDYWNERWEILAAGSWFDCNGEEEKLPAGSYRISWPSVEYD